MGQNARIDQSHGGIIRIDWMVLAAACMALLFLMGTMLRGAVDPSALAEEGFQQLAEGDALLAYQDFSFDSDGWGAAPVTEDLPGLGPVLGPFSSETVQRTFVMPVGAETAQMTFDVHLLGEWTENCVVHVSLGDENVMSLRLGQSGHADSLEVTQAGAPNVRVSVNSADIHPSTARTSEVAAEQEADATAFVTARIGLVVTEPDAALTLRLDSQVEGPGLWTLDNLVVVARIHSAHVDR